MGIRTIDALNDVLIGTITARATIVDTGSGATPRHDSTLESMAGMLS